MLVCSKLELFDSFCLRSIFGAFVGVKAGSDTWHWCYIINTTCDRICRAQHSSAKSPQSSLASYWSESDVLFAQDTKEIICLEKCSNAVTLWMRLNLVWVCSAASRSRHPKGSQLRYKWTRPILPNITWFTLAMQFLIGADLFNAIILEKLPVGGQIFPST